MIRLNVLDFFGKSLASLCKYEQIWILIPCLVITSCLLPWQQISTGMKYCEELI